MNDPKYRIQRGDDAVWLAHANRRVFWTDVKEAATEYSLREDAERTIRYIQGGPNAIPDVFKAQIEEFEP